MAGVWFAVEANWSNGVQINEDKDAQLFAFDVALPAVAVRSQVRAHARGVRLNNRIHRMLKVITQDFIKPEHIQDVMPLYRELVARTKEEPLCVSYDLYIDQKDPGHFVFIEEWPDRAALDAHCNTEHFKRLVPLINKHQRSPGTFLLMDAFQ